MVVVAAVVGGAVVGATVVGGLVVGGTIVVVVAAVVGAAAAPSPPPVPLETADEQPMIAAIPNSNSDPMVAVRRESPAMKCQASDVSWADVGRFEVSRLKFAIGFDFAYMGQSRLPELAVEHDWIGPEGTQ